jgi:hypothetical protein
MATPAPTLRRSDLRLLLLTGAGAIAAGLLVAALLLGAARRESGPREYRPFDAGNAVGITKSLEDGGPYYVADPFGGDRSILFALEEGRVVALSILRPGAERCVVRWMGTRDSFVDCEGGRLRSTQLARYESWIETEGQRGGALLVDLRRLLPPPEAPAA